MKERTDEHMAKNLSRMTREAEQRELRLRDDMEKLGIQQEQSLGTLDTKIDAMMERRTQAIMDRLHGLLSSKSGPKEGEPNSGGPSREPRVNFNEHQKRKTYGSTRGRGSSSGYATRGNGTWDPNSRTSSTGNRQTSNERPTQGTHATGRSDSGIRGHASPRRSHVGQAGNTHGDSDCRDASHTEPQTRCEDTQAGHSRDATAMATAFEPLKRSLETFLTKLSRTNERSEKSRRVFKKPRCYKDESDGCIVIWIEVMKLHFEKEDLSERQECSALTSNLEGTALNCVMAKKQYQRDTAEKIFEILLNRFESGVQGHQVMMRFEKRRQREDDAMMEQDAVHIGYEADVTAYLLYTNGTKIGVTGLLDTGAVVSVMPIKTWERMGFTREDLIPTNLRLAAANRGAIYVAGRTPITVLHMGGRDLWMSFLVVENLDDADQFILGRDFVRNFDVMIDLNNGLIRIRNPDRKYVKRPINRIITDENKVPIFLDRKVKLQPGQAVVAIFRMRNLNSLSDSKQVCLVPNPNSQSSVILGRSFSVTRNGLCVSVLLNTLDTRVSIQRGKKLGYALPMRTDSEETQNLKKYSVKDCPYHANKDKILKSINELKSIHKLFSMKSETDDGLSSCSNFPERPSSYELESGI